MTPPHDVFTCKKPKCEECRAVVRGWIVDKAHKGKKT